MRTRPYKTAGVGSLPTCAMDAGRYQSISNSVATTLLTTFKGPQIGVSIAVDYHFDGGTYILDDWGGVGGRHGHEVSTYSAHTTGNFSQTIKADAIQGFCGTRQCGEGCINVTNGVSDIDTTNPTMTSSLHNHIDYDCCEYNPGCDTTPYDIEFNFGDLAVGLSGGENLQFCVCRDGTTPKVAFFMEMVASSNIGSAYGFGVQSATGTTVCDYPEFPASPEALNSSIYIFTGDATAWGIDTSGMSVSVNTSLGFPLNIAIEAAPADYDQSWTGPGCSEGDQNCDIGSDGGYLIADLNQTLTQVITIDVSVNEIS